MIYLRVAKILPKTNLHNLVLKSVNAECVFGESALSNQPHIMHTKSGRPREVAFRVMSTDYNK